jgi:glycerol-3-phosphate dehydrogenase
MLYGTNTAKVLDLTLENPLLKNKISKDFEDIEAQIVYAIRSEQAFTVEDILERRLTIGLSTNKIDKAIIKTIRYHLTEEFELMARQRDRDIESVLVQGYN